MPPPSFAATAFQSNIELLLGEANRRKHGPLKESLQACIQSKYDPGAIFRALLVGCEVLRGTKMSLLCVTEIGKLASLKLLPAETLISSSTATVAASTGSSTPAATGSSSNSAGYTSVAGGFFSSLVQHAKGQSGSSTTGGGPVSVAPPSAASSSSSSASASQGQYIKSIPAACRVIRRLFDPTDEDGQLKIIQTIIAFVSVCDVKENPQSVEEALSFVFQMFVASTSSIVQGACAATITQTTHTIFSNFRVRIRRKNLAEQADRRLKQQHQWRSNGKVLRFIQP